MSSSYFHHWEIVISRQFRLKWHDWPLFYLWHSWYSPFFLIQPVTAVEWVSSHLVYHMSYNMDWSLKQSWVERESVKSLPCRMGCAPDNGGLSCRISRQVALKRLYTVFCTERCFGTILHWKDLSTCTIHCTAVQCNILQDLSEPPLHWKNSTNFTKHHRAVAHSNCTEKTTCMQEALS